MSGPASLCVGLSDLTSAAEYQVYGYLRWTKPDGSSAYSVSLITQQVVD